MVEQPNLIYTAVKIMTLLAILAGGLIFTLYLLRRFKPFRALEKQNLIRIIATRHIAPKKVISLIDVCGEILVVGISQENLCFLTKIKDKEVIASIQSNGHKERTPSVFSSYLGRFINEKSKPRAKS